MRRLLTILSLVLVSGLLTQAVMAGPLKDRKKGLRREAVRKTRATTRMGRTSRTIAGKKTRVSTLVTRKSRMSGTMSGKRSRKTGMMKSSRKTQAIQAVWPMMARPEDKADMRLTAAFVKSKGRLPWPVSEATITHGFGSYQLMPGIQAYNRGVTLTAEPGSAVTAVAEGKVESVFPEVDAVIIRHGKYFTVYSNLSDIPVHVGDDICEGDLLGRVGEKGQIDFWLSDDQVRYEDPQNWLRADRGGL